MEKKIISDSQILGGKPIIEGTRISVEFILELLSSGMSVKEILKEYNHLSQKDINVALRYATKSLNSPHLKSKTI